MSIHTSFVLKKVTQSQNVSKQICQVIFRGNKNAFTAILPPPGSWGHIGLLQGANLKVGQVKKYSYKASQYRPISTNLSLLSYSILPFSIESWNHNHQHHFEDLRYISMVFFTDIYSISLGKEAQLSWRSWAWRSWSWAKCQHCSQLNKWFVSPPLKIKLSHWNN